MLVLRVIMISSPNDLRDVEKAALNLLRMENTDIKQKQDPVRWVHIYEYLFYIHVNIVVGTYLCVSILYTC